MKTLSKRQLLISVSKTREERLSIMPPRIAHGCRILHAERKILPKNWQNSDKKFKKKRWSTTKSLCDYQLEFLTWNFGLLGQNNVVKNARILGQKDLNRALPKVCCSQMDNQFKWEMHKQRWYFLKSLFQLTIRKKIKKIKIQNKKK